MTLLQALAIRAVRQNDDRWLMMTANRRIWIAALRVIEEAAEAAEIEFAAARIEVDRPPHRLRLAIGQTAKIVSVPTEVHDATFRTGTIGDAMIGTTVVIEGIEGGLYRCRGVGKVLFFASDNMLELIT